MRKNLFVIGTLVNYKELNNSDDFVFNITLKILLKMIFHCIKYRRLSTLYKRYVNDVTHSVLKI